MNGFENPVLKRELKVRFRTTKLIPALALRFLCLGFIFLLVLLSHLGKGLLAFILAEAFLVTIFTPGAACSAFASDVEKRDLRDLALTRLSSRKILLGKIVGTNFYTFAVVALSALVMCVTSLFRENLHVLPVLRANLALLILMFEFTAIGIAFSFLFRRNIRAATMLTYILVLILIGSVIISGPFIEQMRRQKAKSAIAEAALYANPIVMISRSLGRIDIMRTRYMYELADPIVRRGFSYPDWYSAGIIYLGVSCLLLFPALIGFRRLISLDVS